VATLYRIMTRLAALVLVVTFVLCVAVIVFSGGADFSHANWPVILTILFGPAAVIAGVAWVIKPSAPR
jgi:hypothetical protein